MRSSTSLSLDSNERGEPGGRGRGPFVWAILLVLLATGGGFVAYRVRQRLGAAERQAAELAAKLQEASALARQAADRAAAAEASARAAAEGRQAAEVEKAGAREEASAARQQAEAALQEAATARETAARTQEEAEGIRKRAEADIGRLEEALGQIAETRRTALGLVMNLGGDHLKFEFNRAELKAEDRELLSRIAGILATAQDYTISVNGHTDDVGSKAYNQKLSEQRAKAVRDYLVKAGLPADILSVEGHGKTLPLVRESSDAARAKNRRVELGIVNTQIRYQR